MPTCADHGSWADDQLVWDSSPASHIVPRRDAVDGEVGQRGLLGFIGEADARNAEA